MPVFQVDKQMQKAKAACAESVVAQNLQPGCVQGLQKAGGQCRTTSFYHLKEEESGPPGRAGQQIWGGHIKSQTAQSSHTGWALPLAIPQAFRASQKLLLGHPRCFEKAPKFAYPSWDGRNCGLGSHRWSGRWEVKAYQSCPG